MNEIVYLPPELNPSWGELRGNWVQESEATLEEAINWEQLQRYEEWRSTRTSDVHYRSVEATQVLKQQKQALWERGEKQKLPGYTTADAALNNSFSKTIPPLRFMGPQQAPVPAERGGQLHHGDHVANSQMVATALRLMGASTVGFVSLNDKTRKYIYRAEADPKRIIEFEDVPVGYETDDRLVIPYAARWVIVYSIPMSQEGVQQSPSLLARAVTMQAYARLYTIYNQLHEFIRGLGYHSYGATNLNGFGVYGAFAVLAGLGENSRLDCVITPEYGPMVRLAAMATDLPLAITRPISFGVREYCKKCRICAQACPVHSISFEEEPVWQVRGPWNNPGHRAYFRDALACRDYFFRTGSNCGICFAKCPFSQPDRARLLKLLASLQDTPPAMPEGRRAPAEWWNTQHPILGIK